MLACFCCGQLRTTWVGPALIDYQAGKTYGGHAEIGYYNAAWLSKLERSKCGALEVNCGYAAWRRRYVGVGDDASKAEKEGYVPHPIATKNDNSWRDDAYACSEWCVDMPAPCKEQGSEPLRL